MRDTFVLVNLPAFKAYIIRDRKNIWETRTQIGREARRTPTFRADMKYVVLNPDWTVPPTILAQDVLAGMKKGQNTIARKKLLILDAQGRAVDPSTIDWQAATPANFRYTLRQPPGADNALGRVKFIFPNEHSIFLHDTPSQELFSSDQRTFSSGCIRVEHALELARVLLEGQRTRPADWNAGPDHRDDRRRRDSRRCSSTSRCRSSSSTGRPRSAPAATFASPATSTAWTRLVAGRSGAGH